MLKLSLSKLYKLSAVIFATALALSGSASAYAQQSFNKLEKPSQQFSQLSSDFQASSCSDLCYGYNYVPLYRFWSNQYNGHFYTIDENEKNYVIANYPNVWSFEGIAYYVERPIYLNGIANCYGYPIHRFWSDDLAAHFYTMSEAEAQNVINTMPTWHYEGIAFCAFTQSDVSSFPSGVLQPVHRFWSDSYQNHFYTISGEEKNYVQANWPNIWNYEGVSYWAGSR
jgi:hypothetical protein